MLNRIVFLLVAFWAGSLWTVCFVVAPALFRLLDERAAAGRLAAALFHYEMLIGLSVAATLLAASFTCKLPQIDSRSRVLVIATATLPALSEFVLGPMMTAAREAGDMARFGVLHGVAALAFVSACIAAAMLMWRLTRPAA